MKIALSEEAKKQAIASIRRYFDEKREEEIGELHAGLLLDFFLREIGPSVYNGAIRDAQAYFQERTADLEGTCFAPEFDYWE